LKIKEESTEVRENNELKRKEMEWSNGMDWNEVNLKL